MKKIVNALKNFFQKKPVPEEMVPTQEPINIVIYYTPIGYIEAGEKLMRELYAKQVRDERRRAHKRKQRAQRRWKSLLFWKP